MLRITSGNHRQRISASLLSKAIEVHAKINRKTENSTYKFVAPENFSWKLGTCNYVVIRERHPSCNFWFKSVQWGLPPK